MTRIYDRYLVQIFLRAFVICFASLVSLYVIIDAFANIDEFNKREGGVLQMLAIMGEYYGYRVCWFFDRLAPMITTLAAMFTFSWIQRTNELMPLLAAGVPVYRLIAPVLLCTLLVSGATVANQELVVPRIASKLQLGPDDDGDRQTGAHARYDSRRILMGGNRCFRKEREVRPAFVVFPRGVLDSPLQLQASKAKYVAPGEGEPDGGWILSDVKGPDVPANNAIIEKLEDSTYFLHTDVTFEHISRAHRWFEFSSTTDLLALMREESGSARVEMSVLLNSRFTRPLATLTLLFLGLPFVLSGMDRRMVSLVGASLVLSLLFQIFSHFCLRLGASEFISPYLAAWLPVFVFGSLAVAMFDLVKT